MTNSIAGLIPTTVQSPSLNNAPTNQTRREEIDPMSELHGTVVAQPETPKPETKQSKSSKSRQPSGASIFEETSINPVTGKKVVTKKIVKKVVKKVVKKSPVNVPETEIPSQPQPQDSKKVNTQIQDLAKEISNTFTPPTPPNQNRFEILENKDDTKVIADPYGNKIKVSGSKSKKIAKQQLAAENAVNLPPPGSNLPPAQTFMPPPVSVAQPLMPAAFLNTVQAQEPVNLPPLHHDYTSQISHLPKPISGSITIENDGIITCPHTQALLGQVCVIFARPIYLRNADIFRICILFSLLTH